MHKDACKGGERAPHFQMELVHTTWPGEFKYVASVNALDCPVDRAHKGTAQRIDKFAPLLPDLGYGVKPFLVKLQSNLLTAGTPQDDGMMINDPEKTISCSKPIFR